LRVPLIVCSALVALAAPVGAVADTLPTTASASATCKTEQQKQSRACRLNAKPTAKAPWKFSDKSLPLNASFDGKKLKVIATVKGACEEGELNFVKATYPVNASIPVSNREFDADVIVTDSNGKKRSLLLRGKITKEVLSITISASFKEAASCIIGGNKDSVKREL
jgi:hypothetical protein